MYSISNKLKALQLVYNHKLVAVWYDSIISPSIFLPASESEIKCDIQFDSYIEKHLAEYITVAVDEHDISPTEKKFLIWETKSRITQDELFALIRKFLRNTADDICGFKKIMFGFSWWTKQKFQYANVRCSPNDIVLFYKQMLKDRSAYQNKVRIRLEICCRKKKTDVDISIDFDGGSCPLAMQGEYTFENGELILLKK